MGKIDVINFFKNKHYIADIIELEDSATVIKAAMSLGVNTNDIAKTLAFHVDNKIIVVVTSGDARIDNQKYRTYFNTKAKMLSFDKVEPLTGHPVGGVCPFGLKEGIKVYLDISLKPLEYVYPAAGESNCALKISQQDLERITNGTWIDVCTLK